VGGLAGNPRRLSYILLHSCDAINGLRLLDNSGILICAGFEGPRQAEKLA
jgi:hypothetical protein